MALVTVQDVQVDLEQPQQGIVEEVASPTQSLGQSIQGLSKPLEFRQAILDQDRTFSNIVVSFTTPFEEDEAKSAAAIAELRAECEAGVSAFVQAYLLKHQSVVQKRWSELTLSDEQVAKAWAQDSTVVLRTEGTASTVTFALSTASKIHRMLWAIGDERYAGTFYAELQTALGPRFVAQSPFWELSALHACFGVLVMFLGWFIFEGAQAWADGETPATHPLAWSSRLWLLAGTLTELIFLAVVFTFPIRFCQSAFAREICISACYSEAGVRTMKVLPLAILVGCCAAALQVHALDGWATGWGVVVVMLTLVTLGTAVPAFNTLRCKHPDAHSPLVIICLVMLLVLLLLCTSWLYASGHQDTGCFGAYMLALGLLLFNVKRYLDLSYSGAYEQAGYAEWRLLFLLGACLFILGISNAPAQLIAYVPCDATEHELCGAWRAALVPIAAALHGAYLAAVP